MVLAFAEGLHLHLSHRSATGYLNIRLGDYDYRIIDTTNVPQGTLNSFPTATAAAVAYAQIIGQASLPVEFEGVPLHRSNRSSSGYMGVVHRVDRVGEPWMASIRINGKQVTLGYYPTAVQARAPPEARWRMGRGRLIFSNTKHPSRNFIYTLRTV